ncbi:hypothetical protein PVL29_002557 [Vitis rotundifolia]|uniref:Histidine-containing phosphotransfer protein n=1 Tax=Vitis rotundifolia TaxID=103349 RepID=A0AA39AJV7_VITRO|nr:hypothetical protein PVL29_002557 [Vitis rotundifolia]
MNLFRQYSSHMSPKKFLKGFLDGQFTQLQLQDESNPGLWLKWSLNKKKVDFKRVDSHRVKHACIVFHNYYKEQNTDVCLSCLQQVKQEYPFVKSKLETLFRLEQQILTVGGSIPIMME